MAPGVSAACRVCAEPPLNSAKAPFRVGGRVEANWYGQGVWYAGMVAEMRLDASLSAVVCHAAALRLGNR